jgi:cephalosporin hydroxylase
MLVSEQYAKDFYATDKQDPHNYIGGVYDKYFPDIRESATKILEVGVKHGGSIILWKDYFVNATIFGVDLDHCKQFSKPHHRDRVIEIVGDAYSPRILDCIPNNLDVAIDDGSHTAEHMKFFIDNYLPKVRRGGYLFVEDIWKEEYIPELLSGITNNYKIFDTRETHKQTDNLLLMIEG